MTQRKQFVLFIDRCLGKQVIAERLRAEGAIVEVHDDHFRQDCLDEEWLEEVGRRHWVVLTKDKNFQRRELEIAAIARARVQVFQLTAGSVQGSEMADILAKCLSKIAAVANSNRAPFIAKVTRGGKVYVVYSRAKLIRRFGNS